MSDEESEHDEAEEIDIENKSGFYWPLILIINEEINNVLENEGEGEEKSEHSEEAEEEVKKISFKFSL